MSTFGNFRTLRPNGVEDRYLDEFLNRNARRQFHSHPIDEDGFSLPAVNVSQTDQQDYVIEVAAPGFEKSDFDINAHNDTLVIQAERRTHQENETYTRREHNYHHFSRSFTLPEAAKPDKISANYKNGMLRVHVPMKKDAELQQKPRKIEIQ
jgi:HSP20 family protein